MSLFPPNILLIFSHASYYVPEGLVAKMNPDLLREDSRLLKNFSDW